MYAKYMFNNKNNPKNMCFQLHRLCGYSVLFKRKRIVKGRKREREYLEGKYALEE